MSVYRIFITKECLVDADSFEEACENALNDENVIGSTEYLDDELNDMMGGKESE